MVETCDSLQYPCFQSLSEISEELKSNSPTATEWEIPAFLWNGTLCVCVCVRR